MSEDLVKALSSLSQLCEVMQDATRRRKLKDKVVADHTNSALDELCACGKQAQQLGVTICTLLDDETANGPIACLVDKQLPLLGQLLTRLRDVTMAFRDSYSSTISVLPSESVDLLIALCARDRPACDNMQAADRGRRRFDRSCRSCAEIRSELQLHHPITLLLFNLSIKHAVCNLRIKQGPVL